MRQKSTFGLNPDSRLALSDRNHNGSRRFALQHRNPSEIFDSGPDDHLCRFGIETIFAKY
jgi:hypothetical protein